MGPDDKLTNPNKRLVHHH